MSGYQEPGIMQVQILGCPIPQNAKKRQAALQANILTEQIAFLPPPRPLLRPALPHALMAATMTETAQWIIRRIQDAMGKTIGMRHMRLLSLLHRGEADAEIIQAKRVVRARHARGIQIITMELIVMIQRTDKQQAPPLLRPQQAVPALQALRMTWVDTAC